MAALGQYEFLVPNGQYTFSFDLKNWVSLPDANVIQGELTVLPFLQNITVTYGGILTYTYNVTFVFVGGNNLYQVDDIQSEIVSTVGIGGDQFSFTGATIGSQTATQTVTNTTKETVQQAGQVAKQAAQSAGEAANEASNSLFGIDASTLGIYALIGLALIAVIFIYK